MKREQLFDTLTELDDQLLEQYFSMDQELACKHARRRLGVRLTAIAACAAIVLGVCLPAGFLVAHPAGRAIAKGDSAALTEQLNQIEGFRAWQERTAERLEQELPENVWELLQTTPIMDVLTQSQYPDYALKSETFVPYAAGEIEPEILVYYLDDKSEHFSVPKMIDVSPEQYTDEDAPAIYVLDHEGARYELKYAYSLTQSLERQAVHVYEMYGDLGVYRAYLDAETGECIYWSYPARITFVPEGEAIGQAADTMTQRAYEMLAASVRDPEAYTLLTSTEDGLFVCKYVRTFRGTYESQVVYESKDDQKHPTVHSCDCATFTFDATGSMVSFDLAYLGALRNADKEVRAEFYTLSKDYCRSSYFHVEDAPYIVSMEESEYEVVIMPDGALALSHAFSLMLLDGNTASIGYLVPMTAAKEELAHLSYQAVEMPEGERVLLSKTVWREDGGEIRTDYTYDANGVLIGEVTGDTVKTYTYDAYGRLAEERVENLSDPELGYGTSYTYNAQGLVHVAYELNAQGGLTGDSILYEYDGQDRVVYKLIKQNGDATETAYTYGDYGSFVAVTENLPVGKQYKNEVTKDEAGNIVCEKYYVDDRLTAEIRYGYDTEGRLVRIEEFEDYELQSTTEYTYNTVRDTEFKDGQVYETGQSVLFDIEETVNGQPVNYYYERYNQYGERVYFECTVYPYGHEKQVHTVKYDYGYLGQ